MLGKECSHQYFVLQAIYGKWAPAQVRTGVTLLFIWIHQTTG
jgi:hypothetical protein